MFISYNQNSCYCIHTETNEKLIKSSYVFYSLMINGVNWFELLSYKTII